MTGAYEYMPPGATPEEMDAILKAHQTAPQKMYGQGLSELLAGVVPERFTLGADAAPGIGGLLPLRGLAERAAGYVGQVVGQGSQVANQILGTNLPTAPNALERIGERPDQAADVIYGATGLPQLDPNSIGDTMLKSVGRGSAAMIPVLPGAALKPLGILGDVLKFAVPTTEHAGINVGASTLFGTTGGAIGAASLPENQQPDMQVAAPQPTKAPTSFSDLLVNPAEAATPPKQPTSFSDILGQSTRVDAGPSSFSDILAGNMPQPVAPTFAAEGENRFTTGQTAFGLGTLLAMIVGGRYLHGLGRDVTEAGRAARFNNPDFAQQAADYNNAQIARTSTGQISEAVGPQTQAPIMLGNLAQRGITRGITNALDQSKLMQDYATLSSPDQQASAELAAQFGMIHKNMANENKVAAFLETGVDYDTKVSMPPWKRTEEDIVQLTVPQKKLLQDTLAAENEMDNRIIRRNKGATGTDTRHDFYNQDDQQLQAVSLQGRLDPVVDELANRYQLTGKRMMDMALARGFLMPQEHADILAMHPHYVPDADVNAVVSRAFGPRSTDRYTGVEQVNTTPWSAMAQHLELMHRQLDLNDMRVAASRHQEAVQQALPNSPQFLTRKEVIAHKPGNLQVIGEPVGGPRENVYQARDGQKIIFYKADNPDFFSFVSGNNPTRQRIGMDQVGVARRVFSTLTTGIGAVASGRIQPLTNVLRTVAGMPINRPPGYVGGLVDAGMQAATKAIGLPERFQFGYRGPDPTNLLGAAYSGGRTSFDRLALHLSEMFDATNTSDPVNRLMRSITTPAVMDRASTSLRDYYNNTVTAEQRAGGFGGAGSPYRSELPAHLTGTGRQVRLVSANQVPELFMVNQWKGLRPGVMRARNALEDVFTGLSDAGHDYFYRLNRATGHAPSRTQLAYETRELVGDPATRGAGSAARGLAEAMPYFNVSLQGNARRARAYAETPIGTSAAYVSALSAVALYSILTSMRSPQHMADLEEGLSTQQRETYPTFYFNDDPNVRTQFSLAQEDRLLYPIILDFTSKILNLRAAQTDPEYASDLHHFLKDFFSEHIENSTVESTLHALNDQVNFANVPPIINSIGGLTGKTVDFDWARIYNDWQDHNLSFDSIVRAGGGGQNIPNHPVGDTILDDENGKRFGLLLSNGLGSVGATLDRFITGNYQGYKQDLSTWETLGNVGHDWLQGMRDANPALNNILWENQARQSTMPPIVEATERSLRALKETQGAKTAEKGEGMTGTGRYALPVPDLGGDTKEPTDPVKRDLYLNAGMVYSMIESKLIPEIKQIRTLMGTVDQYSMNPEDKRAWMNARTRELADKYRLVHTYIQDLNAYMSQKLGRQVDVNQKPWR